MKPFDDLKERAKEAWRGKQDSSRLRVTVALGSCGLATGAEETRAAFERALGHYGGPASLGTV